MWRYPAWTSIGETLMKVIFFQYENRLTPEQLVFLTPTKRFIIYYFVLLEHFTTSVKSIVRILQTISMSHNTILRKGDWGYGFAQMLKDIIVLF